MDKSRLRRAILPISLLVLITLAIYACVPTAITDLRVVSVSRIPASDLPRVDDLRNVLTQRHETVWKIMLSGGADWARQVRRHELNSYAIIVRCDQRDSTLFASGPYVGQIPIKTYGEGFDGYRPPSGPVLYDIYLPETGRYRSERDFNAPMPSYDLGRQRLTLCISIADGAMTGAYARSNEVKVMIGADR